MDNNNFNETNKKEVDLSANNGTVVNKEKTKLSNVAIAFIAAAICLVLVLIPILITVLTEEEPPVNDPDTGLVLEGSYSFSPSAGAFAGNSVYKFEDNKVTNTYTVNGETKVIEYTYVIAIENDNRVIKLTTKDEEGKDVTTTHDFATGKFMDRDFISINEVYYYKVNEK